MLDFNDQTMNRFVEHQMLTTFKKFMGHCHRHFRKYSDPEEASANPPHILVGHMKDWIFLYDHYMSYAFQVSNDIFYNGYFNSTFNMYKK